MKIGLIGNMNNNNFALMRYLRDLGHDAHLLMYANDGRGMLRHFTPENDTWDIERWRPYLHQTNIPNTSIAALDHPWSWGVSLRSWFRVMLNKQDFGEIPASQSSIRATYTGYDKLVASGVSPATLERVGLKLDLFYPYSICAEFAHEQRFQSALEDASIFVRPFYKLVRRRQISGIRNSRVVVVSEKKTAQVMLEKIGVQAVTLAVPMVYNKEVLPAHPPSEALRLAGEAIERSRLTILHHSRLMFKRPLGVDLSTWLQVSKNNDWLIRAFGRLVSERPELNPILFVVTYGKDVDSAKRLSEELGIAKAVHWLPIMGRRELMWLLSRVTIGCGEFYDVPRMIWGGTGWEALASGKPLLQGFNFADGEFEQIFGYPPPPMLQVRTIRDLEARLFEVAEYPERAERIGREGRAWFDTHNGTGLAEKWFHLLTTGSLSIRTM